MRKERWKCDTGMMGNEQKEEVIVTRGSGHRFWRKGGKDGKKRGEDVRRTRVGRLTRKTRTGDRKYTAVV